MVTTKEEKIDQENLQWMDEVAESHEYLIVKKLHGTKM